MKKTVNKKKQLVGLLYGAAAGLAFSIFAWGIDAIVLAGAHGAYPWVRFIPGFIISLLAGSIAGWVTVRIQNHLVSITIWVLFALLLSKLFIWLPITATPSIISMFNESLGSYLQYPAYLKELGQLRWFGFATIAIVAFVNALIENILIDQALFGTGKIALIVPLVVCALSFSLAGNAIDGLYNRHIREPIVIVNDLIEFAAENLDKEVPKDVSRKMHLSALNTIKEYLTRDRKLILGNFDQTFGQIDILVIFEGHWVKCTTIYGQVTMCKDALETPESLFSNSKQLLASIIPWQLATENH